MASLKTTNQHKIVNKRSTDPFDKLIFEKGLRIKQIMPDKSLNTMLILLNNGQALKVQINHFKSLSKASQADLEQWTLLDDGIGIRWESIDEDLSLKGLIKDSALTSILHKLKSRQDLQELSIL